MGTVADVDGIAILPGLLGPRRVVIALIDDVVGGLVEGLLRIVRRDKPSNAAGEANVGGGLPLLLQFGDVTVVHFARGVGRGEAVAVARGAAQGRRSEAADPNRRMRFLDRLGRELDLVDLEEFALEGERFAVEQFADDVERLVGTTAALVEGDCETLELLDLVADAHAEFEASARDSVDHGDILGEAHRVMERHQQHAERDTDTLGARGDRGGGREHRGQIAVLDEVMFGEPAIVEAVILGPYNLVEYFAIEAVIRLTPLRRIAEVVPEAEADFFVVAHEMSP